MKTLCLFFISALILISCQNDLPADSETTTFKESFKTSQDKVSNKVDLPELKIQVPTNNLSRHFKLNPLNIVEPSECDYNSPFDQVIFESVRSNIDGLGAEWYGTYADMNFYYTLTDGSKQYFGANGQYTNYVNNRVRSLEKFWNMPDEVIVRGQHNSTLNSKEKIIEILTFWYGFDIGLASFYADFFVDFINVESTFLIESPLVSFDGFAIALGGLLGQEDLIVIGDGLIELASASGVEDKVVWSGILAHEWAHQIQFNKRGVWYPEGSITRTTELEADYFTGFYLTHKRGGTYNWKRVEGFLDLFYNLGDCLFEDDGHHGTHIQRMRAAKMGYKLAQSIKAKGKIMTPDQVHEYFLNNLEEILEGN